MSGRKQHYIPQALLRGFSIAETRAAKFKRVWVFDKNRPPFCSATQGVAAVRHFYSEPGPERTLDDQITSYESLHLSPIIRSLREASNSSVAEATARELVSHLVVRNALLRSGFDRAIRKMTDELLQFTSDHGRLARFLGLDDSRPGARFLELFDRQPEAIAALVASGLPREPGVQAAFLLAKENLRIVIGRNSGLLEEGMRLLQTTLDDQIAEGHQHVLSEVPSPTGLLNGVEIAEWMTITSKISLILSDSVALAIDAGGEAHPLLFSDMKSVRQIVLPLSSNAMLVGLSAGQAPLTPQDYNAAAATCSDQFFVASQATDVETNLLRRVGTGALRNIDRLVENALADFEKSVDAPKAANSDFLSGEVRSIPAPLSTFDMALPDFQLASGELAKLVEVVSSTVRAFREVLPVERLDGVTFALDYEGALASLERGFISTNPLSTIPSSYGTGILQVASVVREGVHKVRIIARVQVALDLISEVPERKSAALQALVRALAQVAYHDVVAECVPGYWFGKQSTFLENERFIASGSALEAYFGARMSVSVRPDVLTDQISVLSTMTTAAANDFKTLLQAHWASPDFGAIGDFAMTRSSMLLDCFADLAGYLHGLDMSVEEALGLKEHLEVTGLRNWFDLLQSDLEAWWRDLGKWSTPADFGVLGGHWERLMLCFQVMIWQDFEGGVQVFAPAGPWPTAA